jgi:SAM-dependent methyltransferase
VTRPITLFLLSAIFSPAQITDTKLAEAYWEWEKTVPPRPSEDEAYSRYKAKLKLDGLSDAAIEDIIVRVKREGLRQEGEFYDSIYTKGPKINLRPNALLIEAVKGRKPGKALDVAMGQGRNAIFLARQGWDVTGFDISKVGLQQAKAKAEAEGLKINPVLAADTEFDFGREQWDLIAVIYALEKRSARRVREALKPGGIAVIESGHRKGPGVPFEYQGSELHDIFKSFQILKYEEVTAKGDWGDGEKPYPLVRIIVRKP